MADHRWAESKVIIASSHNNEVDLPRGEGQNWGNGCQDPCFMNVTISII